MAVVVNSCFEQVRDCQVEAEASLSESWKSGWQFILSVRFTSGAPLQGLGDPQKVFRKFTHPKEVSHEESGSRTDQMAGDLCTELGICAWQLS